MRILFVLRPMAGGMKTVTTQYISLVQAAGMTVAAAGPIGALPAGVDGQALEAFPYGRATRQLADVVHAFRPDLLHAHGLKAGVVSLGSAVPVVYTLHGFPPPGPVGGLYRILENRVMARAAALSATSQALAADAAWRSGRPVSALPVATRLPVADPGSSRPEGGPVIGTMGRLSQEKGYDVLLGAFRLFRRTHPQSQLLIGGLGPLAQALGEAAASADLSGAVHLLGWVTAADFYPRLHLYTQPSRREGLGLAAREAVAWGLPVVVSDVGGLREACGEGPWARYVAAGAPGELARAWAEMLSNHGPEMAAEGRAWAASTGGPEAVVQALVDLYRRALAATEASGENAYFAVK